MSKTFEEIAVAFQQFETEESGGNFAALDTFLEGDGNWLTDGEGDKLTEIFGAFKVVEEYGGEGQGEEYYKVVHLTDHDLYFKIDGYYQSYEGVDWSDTTLKQVKPKEVTKTVYE